MDNSRCKTCKRTDCHGDEQCKVGVKALYQQHRRHRSAERKRAVDREVGEVKYFICNVYAV